MPFGLNLDFIYSDLDYYAWQAIGILIGMEDVPPEKQSEYLSSLLTPLCQQVKVELAVMMSAFVYLALGIPCPSSLPIVILILSVECITE